MQQSNWLNNPKKKNNCKVKPINVYNRSTAITAQCQSADLFYHLSGDTLFIVDAGNLSFATCFNTTPNNLWVECKVALTVEINQYPLPLKNRFTDDKVHSSILISLPTYK